MIKLSENNVQEYLESKGIQNVKSVREVNEYTNVNYIFEVTLDDNKKIFIKQDFPYVKVKPDMSAPINRQHFEYLSLKWLNNLDPEVIPEVIEYDKENNVIIMKEAGRNAPVLAKLIDKKKWELQIIPKLARFCAKLHSKTYNTDEMIRPEKENKEHIEFIMGFRLKGAREINEEKTSEIFEDSLKATSSLIYGDFAFKNILVNGNNFYLVDFENVCRFDPAFDIGYLFAHWFVQAETDTDIDNFNKAYESFFEIYSEHADRIPKDELVQINKRARRYIGAIMAHRLVGGAKNPNLIRKDEKILKFLRRLAVDLMGASK